MVGRQGLLPLARDHEIVTTLIMAVTLLIAWVANLGVGSNLAGATAANADKIGRTIDVGTVLSAAIVVVFSAAATIRLPPEGVAVLLAVDFVVDMARTAVNVIGNAAAAMVVAKSEGEFRAEGYDREDVLDEVVVLA